MTHHNNSVIIPVKAWSRKTLLGESGVSETLGTISGTKEMAVFIKGKIIQKEMAGRDGGLACLLLFQDRNTNDGCPLGMGDKDGSGKDFDPVGSWHRVL